MLRPLKEVSVESPNDAVFECEFDLGEPQATVTWYKDNKEVGNIYHDKESYVYVPLQIVEYCIGIHRTLLMTIRDN